MNITKEFNMTHEEMKKAVITAANAFYNGKVVPMNDLVYDEMLKMIVADEPSFNIYEHITYENDGIRVPHTVPFRDFNKVADIQNFTTEDQFNELKSKYYILPKFDGSSIIIEFKNGSLSRVVSRGDDETGLLNTTKFTKKVSEALNRIKSPVETTSMTSYILAECVCNNNDGGRAAANGLVNSKYCQEDVNNKAHLMPFDILYEDGTRVPNLYYEITDYSVFSKLRDTSILDTQFGEIPCDGIVGYSRDLNDQVLDIHKIYFTESMESIVNEISWDRSWNSGIYHPVANFETVLLDGTYVSRASLYNYQNILDTGIRVGSNVKVIKANMTIPQIIESEDKGHDAEGNIIPLEVKCPYCGNPMVQLGRDLICSNIDCNGWKEIFIYRLMETFRPGEDLWGVISTEGIYDLRLIHDLLPENWTDYYLTNITNFMYLMAVPRVGEGKIAKISKEFNKLNKERFTIDEAITFIGDYVSYAQWDYIEVIIPIIKRIFNLLSEV